MSGEIVSVSVTTTGSAGSATGTGTLVTPSGWIEWLRYDFHASAPATTDVTLSYADTPPGGTIHATTDTATDVTVFPRATCVNSANSAITNSYTRWPAGEPITVSVAQSDALTACVTVYAYVVRHQD